MHEITKQSLQPGPMDTEPNIVCDWWDDGVREAGFSCTACEWVDTLYAEEGEEAFDLRERACMLHLAEH